MKWLKLDLPTQIIIGLVLGVVLGFVFKENIAWVEPIGIAFIRLITMIVVPLVFASLLIGTASLGDPKKIGRIGGKTLLFFLWPFDLSLFVLLLFEAPFFLLLLF